jgi:hypothetical protein
LLVSNYGVLSATRRPDNRGRSTTTHEGEK